MACVPSTWARILMRWLSVAFLAQCLARADSAIFVDFAAAVPSGVVYTGTPVELIATLKVTSADALTRDALVRQRGFNPRMTWKTGQGSFRNTSAGAVFGSSTRPPNGLVFVSRSTYIPPALPGAYTISVFPEADPGRSVALLIKVEEPALKLLPSAVTLAPGQEQAFTATFRGGTALSWSVTAGLVSPQGLYQAPLDPGIHTVTVQHLPSGRKASALVTVTNPFQVQPTGLELAPGQSGRFRCTEGPVSWSVLEQDGGTIEPDGTYTAPRRPGTYSVQAAGPNGRAVATARVTPLTLSLQPPMASLGIGQRIQFAAEISHGKGLWSASQGEISSDGLYRAPLASGTYEVSVASSLDPEVRATATVHVSTLGLVQVVPEEPTLHVGQSQQFTLLGHTSEAVPGWMVQPPEAGTITETGLFTAGSLPGPCSIMAFLDDSVSAVSVQLIDTRILPDPAQVRPGGSIQFTAQGLPRDAPGTWTVRPATLGSFSADGLFTAGRSPGRGTVTATAAGVAASAVVRILATRISPEDVLLAPGETVRFTAEAFEAPGQPLAWQLLGDQPGASLGQDGVYRAPNQQGIYRLSAADAAGNAALATVVVGPPSGLVVTPEILVELDGIYTVLVLLKADNGRTVEGRFTGELQRGLAYPEITFPTWMVLEPLGVDGPYRIARISITGTHEEETVVFDVRENLGSTEAFSLEESTQAWIRIGEISDISGQGRDANGLLAALLVTIPVELTAAGDYRIQAALTAEDGTEIDAFMEIQTRARGTHAIVLTFRGDRIRARGKAGPWSITRFTVEGPVVRSRDFQGSVKGYDFRMFQP